VIDFLVNSTIKMSLVVFLALAAMPLMRNRSAALRHWVLVVVVGCAAAIPAFDAIKAGDREVHARALKAGQVSALPRRRNAGPPGKQFHE
jgi:hypothetical protein